MRISLKYNPVTNRFGIDFRMYIFCSMNAILTGIPALTVWGNSLSAEYREGIATIPFPFGIGLAQWHMISKERITQIMNQYEPHKPKDPQQTFEVSGVKLTAAPHSNVRRHAPQRHTALRNTVVRNATQLTILDFKKPKQKRKLLKSEAKA